MAPNVTAFPVCDAVEAKENDGVGLRCHVSTRAVQRPALGEQLVSRLLKGLHGGRQVAQASERECPLWLTQRCFLQPSLPLPQAY